MSGERAKLIGWAGVALALIALALLLYSEFLDRHDDALFSAQMPGDDRVVDSDVVEEGADDDQSAD